jgi:hypothetical protein
VEPGNQDLIPQLRDTRAADREGTTNVLSLDAPLRADLHAGAALMGARRHACVR